MSFLMDAQEIELDPEKVEEMVESDKKHSAHRKKRHRHNSVEEFEELSSETDNFTSDDAQDRLAENSIYLGVVSLEDPLRDRVAECVAYASRGDVNVRIVSGDNIETLKQVAVKAGVVPEYAL